MIHHQKNRNYLIERMEKAMFDEVKLKEVIPGIKSVVIKNEVSEELWEIARKIINKPNKK